jgi:glycine/D-amino acid oxidase-like deaminating enzyme
MAEVTPKSPVGDSTPVAEPASTPWWLEEAPPIEPAPPLRSDARTDVAIVGGGYAGLWTAIALLDREPSLGVTLLEAERCGEGPSGRNGGFLHGYWSMLPWLRDLLGDERALELARAGDGIVPAVRALGADIWLRESGLLEVAATPEQERSIERAVAVAQQLGVPEESVPLTADEIAQRCASPRFRRGVLFRDGATVQPARLARALRAEALVRGAVIHEHTHARDVREGAVETAEGLLRAGDVVVATNSALSRWWPVGRRLAEFSSYVVLTEPVPELLEEIGWTGGEAIADGRMFLHYFRTTNDGRVLMGSAGGTRAHAERGLRVLLPQLRHARITHHWGGPIDVSSDRLPFVGSHGRIHYLAGFTGNGVGPTWLAAQSAASLVLRRDDEWARLPLVRRDVHRLPPRPLKRIGGDLVRRSILSLEEAEEEGRRPSPLARIGAALPRLTRTRVGLR